MAKYVSGPDEMPAWVVVSAAESCRSCGAEAGCARRAEGDFARCYGVVSALPILGGGWLHATAGRAPALREGDER